MTWVGARGVGLCRRALGAAAPVHVIEFRFNHRGRVALASGEIFYVDWGFYIERK